MNRTHLFSRCLAPLLLGLWGCDQQLVTGEPGEKEPFLVDDLGLKEIGDLGPAPLQVEPARPMSGDALVLGLDLPGAVSAWLDPQGRGCGSLSAQSVVPPVYVDGQAGNSGSCSVRAHVTMEDGSVQVLSTGFGVQETDPQLLPVEVTGSVFFADDPPPGDDRGPSVVEIEGPRNFVNGSTLSWTVRHDGVQRVIAALVTVEGFAGHYRLPLSPDSGNEFSLSLELPRDAFDRMGGARADGLEVGVALVGADGTVGTLAAEPMEGTPVGNGDVKVSISWTGGADVDLHVTEPSGETVFYGNRESQTGGELDLDSNPTCDLDGTNAENIFWPSEEAPAGSYRARVHLYDGCEAGSVSGNLTIEVCGESRVEPFNLADGSDELVVDFDAECEGTSVEGRVRYQDFTIGSSGFSSTGTYVPVRYILVQAVTVDGDDVVAEGITDRAGRYRLELPLEDMGSDARYRVRVRADHSNAHVKQKVSRGGSHRYGWWIDEVVDPHDEPSATLNLDVSKSDGGGVLNMWEIGVEGFALLKSLGQDMPKITWNWRRGSRYGSYASGKTIYAAGSSSDPDEYDDFVMGHEMGHVVQYQLSDSDSPGGSHSPWSRVRPSLAWGEGWASYFGATLNQTGRYVDARPGGLAVNHSIETLPSSIPLGTSNNGLSGRISEAVVSAVLWDLHDDNNEEKDTLANLNSSVWTVFTGYLGDDDEEYNGGRGSSGRDLIDFLDGWLCHDLGHIGEDTTEGMRGNVRGIHKVRYDFPDYSCSE